LSKADMCNENSSICECNFEYNPYESPENFLLGVFALPLIIFGIITNIFSVLIFTHESMKNSSINWYLTVISLSDSLILIAAFFVLTLPRIAELLHCWSALTLSYVLSPCMYGFMTMAQTISVWMTTGVALHRYTGVCFPFQSISLLRPKNVRMFLSGILFMAFLFNGSRFFEVHIIDNCFRSNINYIIPVIEQTSLRLNPTYRTIFYGWAYTIAMFIIPFSVLIFVNIMVVIAIRKSNRLHHTSGANPMSHKKSESKERQTTIMLVAIVLMFLACNFLAFVVNILENIAPDSDLFKTLVPCNNLLVSKKVNTEIYIVHILGHCECFMQCFDIRNFF
uniref:G_PROTEIN_RECEP_F1_2 domain-containing protein n=1 Tax=Rhabditophanes sp. KR3021 TaxID=114890 RepID=A0AC35U5A7_9BILA